MKNLANFVQKRLEQQYLLYQTIAFNMCENIYFDTICVHTKKMRTANKGKPSIL